MKTVYANQGVFHLKEEIAWIFKPEERDPLSFGDRVCTICQKPVRIVQHSTVSIYNDQEPVICISVKTKKEDLVEIYSFFTIKGCPMGMCLAA